jgi:hypothetical protein
MHDMKAKVYQFPRPASRKTDASLADRPATDLPTAVLIAVVFLIAGFYLGIGLKDLTAGKQPLVFDVSGAPEPCAPPNHGIWPDCHVPGQK